jgi:hypothetical protein
MHFWRQSIGQVEKLAAAERKFAESMPPMEALRAWMLLFVDYIATKKIIAPALNALAGGPSKVIEASYAQNSGGDSCAGETRYQERRGQKGPGPNRLASGSGRRLLHGDQPGLAAKRQDTTGHPRLRFAAGEIDKQPLVSVLARSLPTSNSARTSSPLRAALSFRCALKSSAGTSYCSAAGKDNWADWDRHSSSVRRDRHISLRRRTEGSA